MPLTLDGGVEQTPDGSWTVGCTFMGISSKEEAEMLSAWLERVVSVRLHEISEVMSIEPRQTTGLQ